MESRALRAIGLTGGIGSGKSTVAGLLVEQGALLVDTDAIALALTQSGAAAMPALEAEFGAAALTADGALDRPHMRKLAFADSSARQRLEAILHPLIAHEALKLAGAAAVGQVVVFDVPLLSPGSLWRQRVDRVLVVDCSLETQVERVARRPGWSAESARQVASQQLSRSQRRAMADAMIHNDGISLDELRLLLRSLWHQWFGR